MRDLFKYLSVAFFGLTVSLPYAWAGNNPNFNKGIALETAGKYEEAIEAFTQAIAEEPSDFFSYYNRGVCRKLLGDYKRAMNDQIIAISLNPNSPNAYYNLAEVQQKLGRKKDARMNYQKVIDLLKQKIDDPLYKLAMDGIDSLRLP